MSETLRGRRSASELRALIEHRLRDTHPLTDAELAREQMSVELDPLIVKMLPPSLIPSAVLIPIIHHEDGLTVLFTQRSPHLRNHAGQVSFPGGRVEPTDGGPLAAAFRETYEEIGLEPEFITPAGYLDPHLTLTGYWITPVVAFVRPGFTLRVDHREVDETFEVPLEFFLDPANHTPGERMVNEQPIAVIDLHYEGRMIWGATANMILSLHRQLELGHIEQGRR